jgi:methionyl-tRNA synthetase
MLADEWLITATPPTPNGDLHLGHLSGPYLASDIVARHLRQCGADVVTMTGIDDNQSYTDAKAIRDVSTAADTARRHGQHIIEAWEGAGIRYDVIGRPDRDDMHAHLTREIFSKLIAQGDIVARVRPLPYCASCDRWSFEAFVRGDCPHCGTPSCGNACEVCGLPNDCADLAGPHCTICGAACEIRDCERLYLPLAPHADMLRRLWTDVRMNAHLAALCDEISSGGLPEIAVSHPATWGIEVPDDRFAGQRIYVWFEMAAGYLAAGVRRDGYGSWHPGRRIAQFFGFDNGYFHAVLFPVIMHAFDPGLPLPAEFVCNEFYRLDGQKFSTSRQHAIWVLPFLAGIPADHLRLYLALDRPATSQTSFTHEAFGSEIYGVLLPRWHDWLTRLAGRCAVARGLPRRGPLVDPRRHQLGQTADRVMQNVSHAFQPGSFSPRMAVRQLDLLVQSMAEHGTDLDNIAGRPGLAAAFHDGVRAELLAAAAFAIGLYPVAPVMAGQLWDALGHGGELAATSWDSLRHVIPDVAAAGDLPAACPLFAPD